MSEKLHFKVSAGLKNIIGKELINDKFIAIFELVKNSYDAGAKNVTIKFENIYSNDAMIYIIDDGKGMSKQEIIDKWLFVAYSEKKSSTYRDNIRFRRNYAGAKGVGRFSCDRLGEFVELISKNDGNARANSVKINWNKFENVDTEEFQNIEVFYDDLQSDTIEGVGTIIKICGLREYWNRDELLQLKKSLTQLVNPEANENYDMFNIILDVEEEKENDQKLKNKENVFDKDIVNGTIVNHVFDVLNIKTTKITASISADGKVISTTLNDRGITLFEIEEKNKYSIKNIKGTLYSLNRAAKINFTRMMGIESVNYGSVFIYKNGFRVYPYGEPEKDFMNIDRRKAQGYNRYLGTREISGRIDIFGDNRGFVETSSRNNGFISSYETAELEDFFYEYLLKPLEKYVVNIIHWGEAVIDSESLASTMDGYSDLEAVLKKIKARFKPEALLKATYNEELTNVILEHTKKNISSGIDAFRRAARDHSDTELLKQADKVERETERLKKEVTENRRDFQEEAERHEKTKRKLEVTQKQVGVLQSRVDVSTDNAIDAMHIMKTYADAIDSNIEEITEMVRSGDEIGEILPLFHEIRQTCSKILNTYNLVINTEYKADTGNKRMDIVKFTKIYTEKHWSHKLKVEVSGVEKLEIMFNPLEFSIIIDNIADNARKANATKLEIIFQSDANGNNILWIDDGYGLMEDTDYTKIFEQGFTTTNGTGIGLYTVKNYAEKMNATVTLNEEYKNGFKLQMRF
ncbi:MAG: sensor histidine kinase [Eubacterium sp.]|jgi:signal transduction histidine kinase|nr:sensor histidine kinase [Eubacterium sp.]